MKSKILLLLIMAVVFSWLACDEDNPTEPVTPKNERGKGLFINQSELRPAGIDTLFINTGDTVKMVISTILLQTPQYSWTSGNEKVLKIVPDPNVDSLAWAIATGDSGTATTLTLDDRGNDATKTIPVKVLRFWADPLRYTYIGSMAGHHYYISKTKMQWTVAKAVCEEDGGHLVTISSKEENDLIDNGRPDKSDFVWIGLTFLFGNDKLTHWITGEPVEYTYWVSGKPSEPGIFAEYYFHLDVNGRWENWHEINYLYAMEME